ncbi:hypothetical protein LP421_30725 (plasmid) [Rhizobium sp. RCAM05350]|nr:hypothetical protein LP421_30725 [Rhizobium sp. RCAM05350]
MNGEGADAVTAGVVTDFGAWLSIDADAVISAFTEAGWLESMAIGAKLSIFKGMSATVWAELEAPSEKYADLFLQIETYEAEKIVFLTGSTSVTAGPGLPPEK